MRVRVVNFGLVGISPEGYAAHCEQIAPQFNAWPGLVAKVWLADPDRNTFGGIYLFEDGAAARASRSTELFANMLASDVFSDATIDEFDTLAGPTAITSPFVAA